MDSLLIPWSETFVARTEGCLFVSSRRGEKWNKVLTIRMGSGEHKRMKKNKAIMAVRLVSCGGEQEMATLSLLFDGNPLRVAPMFV